MNLEDRIRRRFLIPWRIYPPMICFISFNPQPINQRIARKHIICSSDSSGRLVSIYEQVWCRGAVCKLAAIACFFGSHFVIIPEQFCLSSIQDDTSLHDPEIYISMETEVDAEKSNT